MVLNYWGLTSYDACSNMLSTNAAISMMARIPEQCTRHARSDDRSTLVMAIYCAAVSVIVRSSTIESRFPGGVSAYALSRPNETYCTDGQIIRVGFMAERDARFFIARLLESGIVPLGNEPSSEIALVAEGHGLLYPCSWIQLGLFDARPAAWLAGSERGKLAIGLREFELGAKPLQCFRPEELRESYDSLGIKDRVETYRHKVTGELIYVGRPFHAVPQRRWWQFWKKD